MKSTVKKEARWSRCQSVKGLWGLLQLLALTGTLLVIHLHGFLHHLPTTISLAQLLKWKSMQDPSVLSLSRNQSQGATSPAGRQEQALPTKPYRERFRFIHSSERVSLAGPSVNPIPGLVSWRHSLANVSVCNGSQPFILAFVPSAVANARSRDFVRSTWADPSLYPSTRMRVVFVLGATLDARLQEAVDAEAARHNDIIQYNFIDSYRNLTYKSLSSLKWAASRCPDVPFVAKVDDDVLVNPFHLRAFFQQRMASHNDSTRYIYGRLETRSPPHRSGKWGLSKDEYPEDWFPPFVLGPAYVLGGEALRMLARYASHTPFLWLEDVFITGLVASAAGVPHVQTGGLLFASGPTKDLVSGRQAFLTQSSKKNRDISWTRIVDHYRVKYAKKDTLKSMKTTVRYSGTTVKHYVTTAVDL